jgi:ATP-dependent RNA helicase MSS116
MLSRSLARAFLVRAALPRRAIFAKALTPSRPLPLTAPRLIAPISIRGYAAEAVRQVETETDDFFADSVPPTSSSTEAFAPATPAAASTSAPSAPAGVPFTSIKGRIDHDTFKALTFKPFKLTAMSEVQRRVMDLMPFLAGGKMRGPAREAAEAEGRSVEPEEGSREDLLVKAKTGTGKTIVSATRATTLTFRHFLSPHSTHGYTTSKSSPTRTPSPTPRRSADSR